MRRRIASLVGVFTFAVLSGGCYHVKVDTGMEPSNMKITKTWAPSFIGGLVPPAVVETASKCRNGVATVDSQLSFLNMVAAALTLNLYTPMQIDVVCSTGNKLTSSTANSVKVVNNDLQGAISKAAELSLATGKPVQLQY